MKFSEVTQNRVFYTNTIVIIVASTVDSIFYYISEVNNSKWQQVTDWFFVVYGFNLIVSLGFLIVAIARISMLLR